MSITLHMVASLDGYIAKKDDDFSWMEASWDTYEHGVEMNADVIEAIECYVMGSHTYELAQQLGWPYGDTRTFVATTREFTSTRSSVEFYSGDLKALVEKLGEKNIWLVGTRPDHLSGSVQASTQLFCWRARM